MNLIWLDSEHLDRRDLDAAASLLEAARNVDSPHELPKTVTVLGAQLRYGWDGDPSFAALARDDAGRVVGYLEVLLPKWDNKHLGIVEVTVDPLARRQGIGRALFEAGAERVREAGRTLVLTDSWDPSPGMHFAKSMGLDRASDEVARRQELPTLDWARLDQAYAEAQQRAAAYELVRMAGPTPDDMMDEVVRMTGAINDAPIDDLEIEDEVFSPDRVRAFERSQKAQGQRVYRLAARHVATGELAGHTLVGVGAEQPWHGSQYDTSVLRAHRGHRLGVLLKIAMLHWLREEEPQLRVIDTWNAASNAHMIEVNELLGYRVVARGIAWQQQV